MVTARQVAAACAAYDAVLPGPRQPMSSPVHFQAMVAALTAAEALREQPAPTYVGGPPFRKGSDVDSWHPAEIANPSLRAVSYDDKGDIVSVRVAPIEDAPPGTREWPAGTLAARRRS